MQLGAAITAGDNKALQMAKSLIDNPMIVSFGVMPWAISLEVETYSKQSNGEVSKYPVIVTGQGVKQYLADNVAPEPLTWQLSGYIPDTSLGMQNPVGTCWFTPYLDLNNFLLWQAFKQGARIMFKDMDNMPYLNCVISHLETYYQKDCKNKMPFKMTLQELKVIEMNEAEMTETAKNSNADIAGGASDMGNTAAIKTDIPDSILSQTLGLAG